MSATANLKIEIIECKIRILSVVALTFLSVVAPTHQM